MNKQRILELTGMSEDQFYDMYPDQESFCSDYPEACAQLEQAQGGMQVGITYDRSGNPVNISPDVTPSQWQTVDGMYTRPHTVDRFGRPIAPMTDVTTTPVSRVPFNREQPLDVISPLVARYTLPKGMVDNSKPIEKMTVPRQALSPKQTMYNVGSTGAPYSIPASKYSSIVDMLKAAGQDSSFTSRKELAKQLGINNYVGTAAQNMALMNALSGSDNNEMKYGGIHINPANKGKFTAWAKAHGMGVQEAASHVMANKEDYSPTIVKRANFAKNATKFKHEEGGDVFPAMRNFKHGGYYGMDQKFHPNSDSGTYVGGAGYYFQPGGTATSASAPGTSGGVDVSGVPGAGGLNADNSFAGDQFSDMSGLYGNDPFGVGNQAYGEEGYAGNPYDESQQSMAYDPSQYSSEIDPSTGFVKYKKNGMALTKIKRQDPALWQHLKEQGHGARWETGQTDIQRIGRTAGKIGEGLEAGINVAGAIGNYLSNRQKQQNLDKSAMNKGSTASMFTNPEGSGKGDYGVTGSAYGMFKPNQMGNYSFKGMYGKYGMEVPKYAVGGFEPQIETLANYGLNKSIKDIDVPINYESLYALPSIPRDNTRVAPPIIPLDSASNTINKNVQNRSIDGPIDVDLALQAVSGHESGVKPGQTKVGFRTRLIGEGGKRATASGTYQITTDTLKQIFKNDENLRSNFKTFNEFKSAFDTNPNVEYAAARSLMSDHIKNYGVYALGAWYQPAFAKRAMEGDKSVFNIIPRKDYGNKLKWGVDFKNKLNSYNKLAGTDYEIMKYGGQQLGGQVVEMDENEIQQFLAAGGQLEFLD